MNTGYIYQIYDNTNGNKYYGSTKQGLSKRLSKHRGDYKDFLNGKKVSNYTSFKILENEDFNISLVEKVEYNDKIELTARERFYIENNECVNKVIPSRTQKEYREANKDKIKQRHKEYREANKDKIKEYYEANKDKILEQHKEKYEQNKDKFKEQNKEYYEANKDKNKQLFKKYREQNKDKIKEYDKHYREANKDKIKQRLKAYREAKKQN